MTSKSEFQLRTFVAFPALLTPSLFSFFNNSNTYVVLWFWISSLELVHVEKQSRKINHNIALNSILATWISQCSKEQNVWKNASNGSLSPLLTGGWPENINLQDFLQTIFGMAAGNSWTRMAGSSTTPGRPRISGAVVAWIEHAVQEHLTMSPRAVGTEPGTPFWITLSVSHKELGVLSYKISHPRQLPSDEYCFQLSSLQHIRSELKNDLGYLDRIQFSDECVFHTIGAVHKHNVGVASTEPSRCCRGTVYFTKDCRRCFAKQYLHSTSEKMEYMYVGFLHFWTSGTKFSRCM